MNHSVFPRSFAAVIFDLDGTLIHSAPDIAAALNAVLAAEGLQPFPLKETLRFVGAGAERLIGDSFAARGRTLSPADIERLTGIYLETYARGGYPTTDPYKGCRETLDTLRDWGMPVAVCTNKAEGISRILLAQLDLDHYFPAIIGADSGFGRKPESGPLREACRQIGVVPQDVLMVGDTVTDVRTARAAGAHVAAVRYGYSQSPVDTLGADIVIESLSTVLNLVSRP